jgi:hypothetical protein
LKAANDAVTVASTVLGTQLIGPDGSSTPSGADAANPIYTAATGGVAGPIGKYLTGMGARFSPVHFTAAYATGTTITISGLPFPVSVEQFVGVWRMDNSGDVEWLSPDNTSYQFSWSDPTLTITGASLVGTDSYMVVIAADPAGLNLTLDAYKNLIQNWPVDSEATPVHQDRTDDAAATNYYPSSNGFELVGYRRGTLEFSLVDSSFVVQGRNHADLAWTTITPMATIYRAGTVPTTAPDTVGGAGLTVAGYLDFQDLGVDEIRLAVTTYDATNTTQLNWRWRA